jgi:hypothetical protein
VVEENVRPRVRLIMEERRRNDVYPPDVLAAIDRVADVTGSALTAEQLAADPHALDDVEVLLTGWARQSSTRLCWQRPLVCRP